MPLRPTTARWFPVALLLLVLLAACGGDSSEPEDDRSFAPEAQGDVALPTDTPAPTSTFAPIDSQPGEDDTDGADSEALLNQTGYVTSVLSGLTDYRAVEIESGDSATLFAPRSADLGVSLAPDGQRTIVIDRSSDQPQIRMLDQSGKELASWSAADDSTPIASPVAQGTSTQLADRVAWSQDSSRVAIWMSGVGLLLSDRDLNVHQLTQPDFAAVTALAFSPSGQSLAAGIWKAETNSASILSISVSQPNQAPGALLQMSNADGRYIRTMAWGNEQVGIVFALRNAGSGSSLPNDLYRVRRFGEPMQLVASAGVAAPAAMIDQVAIAGDGQTLAYSILIPAESGYRLHSIWAADALDVEPVQVQLNGLRRVTELAWTTSGLAAAGYTRSTDDEGGYVNAVINGFATEEGTQIVAEQSPATPAASPVASEDQATPET